MKVGQEVLCVDGSPSKTVPHLFQEWPKEGKIYTIRRLEGSLGGQQRVLLEEIHNSPVLVEELGGKAEPGFAANRFKPLVEDSIEEVEENEEVLMN